MDTTLCAWSTLCLVNNNLGIYHKCSKICKKVPFWGNLQVFFQTEWPGQGLVMDLGITRNQIFGFPESAKKLVGF